MDMHINPLITKPIWWGSPCKMLMLVSFGVPNGGPVVNEPRPCSLKAQPAGQRGLLLRCYINQNRVWGKVTKLQ